MNSCVPVSSSLSARCDAIRQLIRPQEVMSYTVAGLHHAPWRHFNPVESIACYLKQLDLIYIADPVNHDYWCPPAVTIRRGGGDCDDFSILAASMLRAAEIRTDVVLGWWRQQRRRGYHAWVAGIVSCGCKFVLEPQTGQIWWNETPPDRDAEYRVSPEGCSQVNRHLKTTG
jgi:Transglutaminase-like superfamily